MNFQSFDYFIAVAEERSFTRAAARLAVTQQTLSAHIAGLERELGVRLLERHVPLQLTYAGEEFLAYAHRFQAGRRAMEQEFRDISGDQRGLLRVGVASTRGHIIMPDAIARFQADNPKITVSLYEDENQDLVQMLREGRLEMVVATVDEGEPGIVVSKLYDEAVVLLVREELLDAYYGAEKEAAVERAAEDGGLKALERLPFLLVGERDVPGAVPRSAFQREGIDPDVRALSKNSETLVALAARGVGACFCSHELAVTTYPNPAEQGMRMIDLGEGARYPVNVAWRDSPHTWSMIEAFDQALREGDWPRLQGAAGPAGLSPRSSSSMRGATSQV